MASRRFLGLLALTPGLAMTFMDQTILPVALPTIQKQFLASNSELQWAINAYLLATGVLLLAAGKLSERIGPRWAFLFGILLFTLSSALCSLSPNIRFLIGARGLQGVGAALIISSQTALLAILFPPEKRSKATGWIASCGSLFLILGPLVGGFLTQMVSWRAIFWINLPIAFLGTLLVFLFLPDPKPGKSKIDPWGFAYFVVAVSSLALLFMQGNEWGWRAPSTLWIYLLIALSFFFLIRREKKASHPFLDLTLFKHPVFTAANLSLSLVQFILMVTVFRSIYFQTVLKYTPFETGILTFITCLPIFFVSPLGGYLSDKIGPKIPVAIGFSFLLFSFILPGLFPVPSLTLILITSIPFGTGLPLILTPSYSAALSSIPSQKIGTGSAIIGTSRTLATAAGIALIGLMTETVQISSFTSSPNLPPLPPSQLAAISNGSLSIRDAVSSPQLQIQLSQILLDAQIASFSYVHYALAVLLFLIFAIVFTLHHRKSAHRLPSSPAEGWD